MTEEIKLKPCPFCGGEAKLWFFGNGAWFATCGCGDCDVKPKTFFRSTPQEAAEIWNRRAEKDGK